MILFNIYSYNACIVLEIEPINLFFDSSSVIILVRLAVDSELIPGALGRRQESSHWMGRQSIVTPFTHIHIHTCTHLHLHNQVQLGNRIDCLYCDTFKQLM